jgi:PRTRC genetic system protein C
MAIQVQRMTRVFYYGGMKLADINPAYSPVQIREHYTTAHPDLATASIEGPQACADGTQKYTFQRAVGAKG